MPKLTSEIKADATIFTSSTEAVPKYFSQRYEVISGNMESERESFWKKANKDDGYSFRQVIQNSTESA